jgi:hypothetical protein
VLSKQTFAAFCLGAITAVAALFLLSAQYSDYRRTAEIKQEIQMLAPLQEQLAAELANGGIKSSLQTIQAAYPSVQAVSRDGWILLRTPRFGQEVVLIPQAEGNNIRWMVHYNDTDKVINGKALCF